MSLKGVNFQLSATNVGEAAFASFQRGLKNVQNSVGVSKKLTGSWNQGLNANRRAVQQLGFQVGDFATQLAGGQNAMLAFVQQGGQMLQFFGPLGAVLGAFLAVFGSLWIAMSKTGASIDQLYPFLGVLADEFRMVIDSIAWLIDVAKEMGTIIVRNLDQIILTAGVAAAYFGTMWVAGMVAATAATFTFVGALNLVKAALIRTGIGALIVLAGYLVERFLTLARGAGGFGEALGLLGDVAREVGERMKMVFEAIGLAAVAAFNEIMAIGERAFNFLVRKAESAGRRIGLSFQLMTNPAQANSIMMKYLLDENVARIESMIPATSSYAAAATKGWAAVTEKLAGASSELESWKTLQETIAKGEIGVPTSLPSGGSAGEKGAGGSAGEKLNPILERQKALLDSIIGPIENYRIGQFDLNALLAQGVITVGQYNQKLTELRIAYLDAQNSVGAGLELGLTKLTQQFSDATALTSDFIVNTGQKFSGSLSEAFKTGDASARKFFSSVLGMMIDTITQLMIMKPLMESVTNMMGGMGGGMGGGILGKIFSFDGGGSTGSRPRTGGLDGKGGFMAMVHPNETVIDHTKGQNAGGEKTINVIMNITTPDAQSFQRSRGQISAELARMVREGTRGN